MVIELLIWTGAVVWLVLAIPIGRVIYAIGRGLVMASSWVRWAMAATRANHEKPRWRVFFPAFWVRWLEFVVAQPGSIRTTGPRGYWYGVGNWKVYPPVVDIGSAADALWNAQGDAVNKKPDTSSPHG